MAAYPQVAHFDVSLAIQVSQQFLKIVRRSVPDFGSLENQLFKILPKGLKDDTLPYLGDFDGYLKEAFCCTVLPVEAIVSQLTFVVIADLSARTLNPGPGNGFADYKNPKDGELVKGKEFWDKTVNHFGLSFGAESGSHVTLPGRIFNQVVSLHQQLNYPESAVHRTYDLNFTPQPIGITVEDYYHSRFQQELKSVASETVESVRQVNYLLSKIETKVLGWRSPLEFVEESKPNFWLGENAKSFDLAMTAVNKLFLLKPEPRIISPIRDMRRRLAHRARKIPVDTEIPELIKRIESLQEEIALRESPVGEALSDLNKFRLLTERGTLRKELDEKCGRLLQIRQDLTSIHRQIVGDFKEFAISLKTFRRVISETRSRFGFDQVPEFFGDRNLSSPGEMFERAGRKSVQIATETNSSKDATIDEQAKAFLVGGTTEGVGQGTVTGATKLVAAAQAGETSRLFLNTMKVAPLVGTIVQIAIAGSDVDKAKESIINEFRKILPIPVNVFDKFVRDKIENIFKQELWERVFKILIFSSLTIATGGVTAIFLAGAFALAEKIEESDDYKELVRKLEKAVGEGFADWEQSLVDGNS